MNASRDVLILEQMHVGGRRESTVSCLVMGVTNQRRLLYNTRAVRKVSRHFEYLENRSRDLDVTLQLERPCCVSVNGHSPVGLVNRQ